MKDEPISATSDLSATSNVNQNISGKKIKYLFPTVLFFLVVIVFSSWWGYKISFKNRLVVSNQSAKPTLNIKSLSLKKGGFLVIDMASSPSQYIFQSEYLPAGVYKNFDVAYSHNLFSSNAQNELRAYVFEDTNETKVFDNDIVVMDAFGSPLLKHFFISKTEANAVSCAGGFNDEFSGDTIDKATWGSYLWNNLEGGYLLQQALGNLYVGNATTLYSNQDFFGDLEASALIQSFDVSGAGNAGASGTLEFEIFTIEDRVASIKWTRSETESFLELGLSSQATEALNGQTESSSSQELSKKYDVKPDKPLALKIRRTGNSVLASYLGEDGVYKDAWHVPNVSNQAVYVGIESADASPIPTKVISTVDKISVGCP